MPIQTTYPNQFAGFGRTFNDFGLYLETHQGYAQIPAVATASVPILDLASQNPLAPVQLTLPATSLLTRSIISITGVVRSAESSITLSASGTIRVATTGLGLAGDATPSAAFPVAAVPRTPTGALVLGTTIPSGTVLVNGGSPQAGFVATVLSTGQTFSLYGSNNDTTTSTAINMSSSVPARPAFVLVTIRSLVRGYRVQQVSDYPELPRAVRELLQITV